MIRCGILLLCLQIHHGVFCELQTTTTSGTNYKASETTESDLCIASSTAPFETEVTINAIENVTQPITETPHRNSSTHNDMAIFYEIIKIQKKVSDEADRIALVNAVINTEFENLLPNKTARELDVNVTESMDGITPVPLTSIRGRYSSNGRVNIKDCPNRCETSMNRASGSCTSSEECQKRGGVSTGPCCENIYVCCIFVHFCGETSSERLVHFQSPDYPLSTKGSLACDFDLNIQKDVCAVQLDFIHTRMFSKLGGVCDVDQILILNSVDGPTGSQCGDLTGYSTSVAVQPGQTSPLKVVVIAQNEGHFLWDIRLRQIRCAELVNFRRPPVCGSKSAHDPATSFYQLLDIWKNSAWHSPAQHSEEIWWRNPSPVFNRFYYETTKKVLHGGTLRHLAEDRIISGEEAELHEFPWQAAIILKRVFFCGGALINEEFVLSAAHCFLTQDTPVDDLVVFLGDHDLTLSNDTISDIRGVKKIHYHAHFHTLLLSNDIALLQLDRPVEFSQRIRPVCLPNQNSAVIGLSGTVAGWGVSSYPDGKPSAVLQKLDVQIMSNEFCESALNEALGPGNLCAVASVQQGTCFGDSGGPLTIDHHGKETLIGIVSFGVTGCAVVPGLPDLYTRVSEYIRWIDVVTYK